MLLGPNGSGKTTLLKLIATQLKPKVNYRLSGLNPYDKNTKETSIIYITEDSYLPNFLSIREYLQFSFKLQRINQDFNTVLDRLCNLFKLGDPDILIKNLSTGYKKRLHFAFIFIKPPKILLLDEPFNGLDIEYREYIQDVLFNLIQENSITSIITTHIPENLIDITNNHIIISNGKIKFQGNWK